MMSAGKNAYTDKQQQPDDVAPPDIVALFEDDFDSKVDEYIEAHPAFQYDSYEESIKVFKEGLKTAGKKKRKQLQDAIANLEWMKVNYRVEAKKNLLLWEQPCSVHALKVDLVDEKEEWVGLVWYSPTQIEEVELTDAYVKHLLTPEALKFRRFRTGIFLPLQKYDRQVTLDETHFRGIRKRAFFQYELVDILGRKVKVSGSWAHKNIPEEALRDAIANVGSDKFCKIPEGSPGLENVERLAVPSTQNGPLVMFRNKGKQQLCLQKCLASALHYLGYIAVAEQIANGLGKTRLEKLTSKSTTPFERFKLLVLETMKENNEIVRYRKAHYDPFNTAERRNNPIVVSLKAATMAGDKKEMVCINHGVCFVGDYIFDANHDRALEITKESLDFICDNIVGGASYNGIFWSRELIFKTNKRA